mmetsp:Transcript_113656/g.352987  ORF Transcript_113656/g.352987 Transcript_113656/m.352987 type:complete len:277 (+) Transcript_113656:918-1748(+)
MRLQLLRYPLCVEGHTDAEVGVGRARGEDEAGHAELHPSAAHPGHDGAAGVAVADAGGGGAAEAERAVGRGHAAPRRLLLLLRGLPRLHEGLQARLRQPVLQRARQGLHADLARVHEVVRGVQRRRRRRPEELVDVGVVAAPAQGRDVHAAGAAAAQVRRRGQLHGLEAGRRAVRQEEQRHVVVEGLELVAPARMLHAAPDAKILGPASVLDSGGPQGHEEAAHVLVGAGVAVRGREHRAAGDQGARAEGFAAAGLGGRAGLGRRQRPHADTAIWA